MRFKTEKNWERLGLTESELRNTREGFWIYIDALTSTDNLHLYLYEAMANTIFKRVFSEAVARIYEYGAKIRAVIRGWSSRIYATVLMHFVSHLQAYLCCEKQRERLTKYWMLYFSRQTS